MNRIKLDSITYPYVNIYILAGQEREIGINLKEVYLYIDEHSDMGSKFKYGNAYNAIRIKVAQLIGRKDVRVSKREVSSLIKCRATIFNKKYVKIPYKMYFIFKVIFEIVDELKRQYPLPRELECFIGKIRRECFYDIQSDLYEKWYQNHQNNLTKDLYDDLLGRKLSVNSGKYISVRVC